MVIVIVIWNLHTILIVTVILILNLQTAAMVIVIVISNLQISVKIVCYWPERGPSGKVTYKSHIQDLNNSTDPIQQSGRGCCFVVQLYLTSTIYNCSIYDLQL